MTDTKKLIQQLRFLASGQDDVHSMAIAEAADALEAMSKDAQRYRWLRKTSDTMRVNISIDGNGSEIAETLDAAINAAIAKDAK